MRNVPAGISAMDIGAILALLCSMPVTNARELKGLRVVLNSDCCVEEAEAGICFWACMKIGLVDGWGLGAGVTPKSGGVCVTVGVPPRLTADPSSLAAAPIGGCSRLPARSVAKARNS